MQFPAEVNRRCRIIILYVKLYTQYAEKIYPFNLQFLKIQMYIDNSLELLIEK
jgi:hypothetical protein